MDDSYCESAPIAQTNRNAAMFLENFTPRIVNMAANADITKLAASLCQCGSLGRGRVALQNVDDKRLKQVGARKNFAITLMLLTR